MNVMFLRWWFSVGQADAFNGVWDNPPCSAVRQAYQAYRAGQVAAGEGRFYRRNRAMVSGFLW